MRVLFWLSIGLDRRTPSEHLLIGMIEALYQHGHTVHILQKDTGGAKEHLSQRMQDLGVTTTYIPCKSPHKGNFIKRFWVDTLYALKCRKWLQHHNEFDRVFLQSSNVAGLQVFISRKHLQGVPVIFNVQDIFPENACFSGMIAENSFVYKLLSRMQRYAYQNAAQIVTISDDMKDLLVACGVPSEHIEVVYNWSYQDNTYDRTQLDCTEAKSIFGGEHFNVVYAGNIGMMQNVDTLIKAAALMKEKSDIWFHVIGDGLYKQKLIKIANELSVKNITFGPMRSSDSAPAIYCTADINVIPLAQNIYKTALPSKTATCLACQQPIIFCIGKESKFAKSANKQTNCPVVESNDAESLCQAILAIKTGKVHCNTSNFFIQQFGKTRNSSIYADLIENAGM